MTKTKRKQRDIDQELVELAAQVKADPELRARWNALVMDADGKDAAEASAARVRSAAEEMRVALSYLTPVEREAAILEVYEPTESTPVEAPSTGPKLRADAEASVVRVVSIVRAKGPGSVERKAIARELGVSLQAANRHVRNAILTGRLVPLTKSLVALPQYGRAS